MQKNEREKLSMKKEKFFIGFLFCVLVLGGLIACSRAKKGLDKTESSKIITFGSADYFTNDSWDGAVGWNGWIIESYGVAETLFRLDDNFVANPWLAKSIEQIDDMTWRLILREDVFYHNGKPMTAASVKKCFERTIKINERTMESIPVIAINAEGQTLTIACSENISSIANALADPLWLVYDAESEDDFGEVTYYTGPFKSVSLSPFDKAIVERFDSYWGVKPALDGAVFLTVTDFNALTMSVQNGEIDIIVGIDSTAIPIFQSDAKLTIEAKTSTRGQFFAFNMRSPVVHDLAVRTAISMCIDREGYSRTITNNSTDPSYGIYPAVLSYGGTNGLNLTVKRYDPEGAKKILADAGYTDSNGNGILDKDGVELSVKLIIRYSEVNIIHLTEIMIPALAEVGIKLNVDAMETYNDVAAAGNFDIWSASYGMAPNGTPEYLSKTMFVTGGSNNYGRYSNQKVDALINEFSTISDISQRDRLVLQMEQKLLDDCAFIFFAHKKFTCVYNNNTVAAFRSQPSEYYILDSEVRAK
jgi:peptide/nickel transport system substrate-binding protein